MHWQKTSIAILQNHSLQTLFLDWSEESFKVPICPPSVEPLLWGHHFMSANSIPGNKNFHTIPCTIDIMSSALIPEVKNSTPPQSKKESSDNMACPATHAVHKIESNGRQWR